MTLSRVVLLGRGRVAVAMKPLLDQACTVAHIDSKLSRMEYRSFVETLGRASDDNTLIVNVAGVAHLGESPNARTIGAAIDGNILLPLALREVSDAVGAAVFHVSSVKADFGPEDRVNLYAATKAAGDELLGQSPRMASASIVIARPRAILAPPFSAGNLGFLFRLSKAVQWESELEVKVTRPIDLVSSVLAQMEKPTNLPEPRIVYPWSPIGLGCLMHEMCASPKLRSASKSGGRFLDAGLRGPLRRAGHLVGDLAV